MLPTGPHLKVEHRLTAVKLYRQPPDGEVSSDLSVYLAKYVVTCKVKRLKRKRWRPARPAPRATHRLPRVINATHSRQQTEKQQTSSNQTTTTHIFKVEKLTDSTTRLITLQTQQKGWLLLKEIRKNSCSPLSLSLAGTFLV